MGNCEAQFIVIVAILRPLALGTGSPHQTFQVLPELAGTRWVIVGLVQLAGGANNQLAVGADGQRLSDAGILYAPDYVINGGGIINVSSEYYGDLDEEEVMESVAQIGPRLTGIFEEAAATGKPTNVIADTMAQKIIAAA